MIRTLTIAAAAAAVGYALGQRAGDDEQSRFSRPEVTGDEVSVDADIGTRRHLSSDIGNSDVAAHRIDWTDNDEDGRVGQ